MTIEAVEPETCEECGVATLCAYIRADDPYHGAYVCLACICKAFGVKTPTGPYTPWQTNQVTAGCTAQEPDAFKIDHTATISPELQAEAHAAMQAAKEEQES